MRPLLLAVVSTEYVKVRVETIQAGVIVNPTGNVVKMAFLGPNVDPVSGDWKTSSWETDSTLQEDPQYYARCLVGPAGVVSLAKGEYKVWVQVTAAPEIPAKTAGDLKVY